MCSMKLPLFASKTNTSPGRIIGGLSSLISEICCAVSASNGADGRVDLIAAGTGSAFGGSLQRLAMTSGFLLTAVHMDDCASDAGVKTSRADTSAKAGKKRGVCRIIPLAPSKNETYREIVPQMGLGGRAALPIQRT